MDQKEVRAKSLEIAVLIMGDSPNALLGKYLPLTKAKPEEPDKPAKKSVTSRKPRK